MGVTEIRQWMVPKAEGTNVSNEAAKVLGESTKLVKAAGRAELGRKVVGTGQLTFGAMALGASITTMVVLYAMIRSSVIGDGFEPWFATSNEVDGVMRGYLVFAGVGGVGALGAAAVVKGGVNILRRTDAETSGRELGDMKRQIALQMIREAMSETGTDVGKAAAKWDLMQVWKLTQAEAAFVTQNMSEEGF